MNDYTVLSIDAWGNQEDGYEWNSWHKIGTIECDINNQDSVISALVAANIIHADAWVNHGDIEDDGYNLVIVNRSTREPVFAVEYGSKF